MNKPLSFLQFPAIVDPFGRVDALRVVRCIGFIATVLILWVSLRPFPDLGDPTIGDGEKGKLATTYITLGMLSVVVLLLTAFRHAQAFRSLLTPMCLLLCCWMCINTVFSHDFEISAQRLILTASAIALAASLLLLPDSQGELDLWLSAAALIFLAVCYLGVILAPSLSIHLASDMSESQLAGDWRGPYGHKNVAAPIMAMLVFVGLYLASRRAVISGVLIASLAAFFLISTGGKSAMALCVVTLVLSVVVAAIENMLVRACLCFLPLLCLNLLTVGSVFSERLAAVAKLLPFDATFTGRTDIWEFAISSLALHPLLGYGFAAFWGTDAIENLVQNDQIEWTASASHSHNGYLDSALTMGYPGLALIVIIFVVAPLRNFSVATRFGNDEPLAKLFLRIWLFGIYLSSMESFLLDRADPIWFTFLVGVVGLHYLARFRLTREPKAD
ncbi:MAG TPA: O-antigen ligase [Bradyrhizobium sp.]